MKIVTRLARVVLSLAALAGAVAAPTAFAAFPDKQVKLVVPYPPGGLGDRSARLIADSLAEQWKQPVVVDNRPGASTMIASQAVASATKDGHTLYLCNTQNATNEVLYKTMPYKLADIAPVSIIVRFPFALITAPSVPAGNVAELIDYAKKNPGKVNFATFGPSSTSNFLAHAFAAQHGLNIATVPYKGTSQVMPDLMSGAVHVFFDAVAPSVPLYRDKKLKILGVNATERLPLAAEIPTMAEQGFPFRYESWFGICTTAGTPPDVMARLSESVRKAVASDEFQKRMKDAGTVPVSSPTPEEFSRFMKDEIDRWGSVIRPLNIKVD